MSDSADESIDLVDEADRVLAQVTRRQMRAQNLLHRSVFVLCSNSADELYVHRRTDSKDVFPGLYDMFVGGVVAAGESYEQAAVREAAEELGVEGPRPQFLFKHRYEGPESRSHIAVFRVIWDGPIHHQASEVAWGRHFTLTEVVENAGGFRFVPDGLEVFERYLASSSAVHCLTQV